MQFNNISQHLERPLKILRGEGGEGATQSFKGKYETKLEFSEG